MHFFLAFVFSLSFSFAAEQKLASNFIYAVMPSVKNGEILAISEWESASAINKIEVNLSNGDIQFGNIENHYFPYKEYSLVDNDMLSDNTGMRKKKLWFYEGGILHIPYYGLENRRFKKLQGAAIFNNGKFELKNNYLDFDTIPKIDTINGIPFAINSTAKIGNETFSAALCLQSHCGFLLKENTIIEMPNSEMVIAVADFPINSSVQGLAVATFGKGLLFSADAGKTWKSLMNRTPVGNNLGSIRVIPSVLADGATSLIAYKVSENAKISIEVFSYDMKKIRTIVKNAQRQADPVRSANKDKDIWDGKDDSGKPAAMGTYYIKVSDNHKNTGWGKVMYLGGN